MEGPQKEKSLPLKSAHYGNGAGTCGIGDQQLSEGHVRISAVTGHIGHN
jgi:hypothetical protein